MSAAALRELVLPVAVIAASEPGATSCATATTTYVSVRPPVLCVALRPSSRTAQMVLRTSRFSVSLLGAEQADLAALAGRPVAGDDKMAEVGIIPEASSDPRDPPGVGGAAAVLWCHVRTVTEVGDHLVVFGEVTRFRGVAPGKPLLLRHHRRYLATGKPASGAGPEGYPI